MAKATYITSVAASTPFDNSTNGFTATDVQAAIEEIKSPPLGGTGVTPPFMFSKSGGTAPGSYFYVGQVVSSKAGQLIPGNNTLVKLSVTSSGTVGSNTVIQLQRRTAVATFVDIPLALVTIPTGAYKATVVFSPSISIGPDWEIACYVKSGSSVSDGVVLMFLLPA